MGKKLQRYFISGLIFFLPLTLTVFLFVWTVNFADGLLGQFIKPYFIEWFGFYFEGMSIVIGIVLIVLLGILATHVFGKIYGFFEKLILKLPFFRQVYPAIKEMAVFVFSREKLAFKQVVVIEYPRKGIYSFGFLTNECSSAKVCDNIGQELCNVFVPSAPGPLTGFVVMVPKKDLVFSDVTVEDAIRFNVSGGVVNPSQMS